MEGVIQSKRAYDWYEIRPKHLALWLFIKHHDYDQNRNYKNSRVWKKSKVCFIYILLILVYHIYNLAYDSLDVGFGIKNWLVSDHFSL